jgi:hypothetical protein
VAETAEIVDGRITLVPQAALVAVLVRTLLVTAGLVEESHHMATAEAVSGLQHLYLAAAAAADGEVLADLQHRSLQLVLADLA